MNMELTSSTNQKLNSTIVIATLKKLGERDCGIMFTEQLTATTTVLNFCFPQNRVCTTPLLYTTPAVVGMILNKNKTFHKAKAFKLLVDSGSSIYQELCRMLLYATLGFHFLVGYLRISCITRKLVFSRFGKTVARIGVLLMLRGGTLFVHIGLKKKT